MEQFFRTYLLFGAEAMEKLKNSHVAVLEWAEWEALRWKPW